MVWYDPIKNYVAKYAARWMRQGADAIARPTEVECMQSRFNVLKDIRELSDEIDSSIGIEGLIREMTMLHKSQYLVEKFPKHFEYESALYKHLKRRKHTLRMEELGSRS